MSPSERCPTVSGSPSVARLPSSNHTYFSRIRKQRSADVSEDSRQRQSYLWLASMSTTGHVILQQIPPRPLPPDFPCRISAVSRVQTASALPSPTACPKSSHSASLPPSPPSHLPTVLWIRSRMLLVRRIVSFTEHFISAARNPPHLTLHFDII